MELDQIGGDKRGPQGWVTSGSIAVSWTLGEAQSFKGAKQGAILLGDRAGQHKSREPDVRIDPLLRAETIERTI